LNGLNDWNGRQKVIECRGNRNRRFIFQDRGAELYVSFIGNHDEIRALLRRGAYRQTFRSFHNPQRASFPPCVLRAR